MLRLLTKVTSGALIFMNRHSVPIGERYNSNDAEVLCIIFTDKTGKAAFTYIRQPAYAGCGRARGQPTAKRRAAGFGNVECCSVAG